MMAIMIIDMFEHGHRDHYDHRLCHLQLAGTAG